jgi:hypothetical protein
MSATSARRGSSSHEAPATEETFSGLPDHYRQERIIP